MSAAAAAFCLTSLAAASAATFASFAFIGPAKFDLTSDGGHFTASTTISFNYVR
jgi:hypothetical protein